MVATNGKNDVRNDRKRRAGSFTSVLLKLANDSKDGDKANSGTSKQQKRQSQELRYIRSSQHDLAIFYKIQIGGPARILIGAFRSANMQLKTELTGRGPWRIKQYAQYFMEIMIIYQTSFSLAKRDTYDNRKTLPTSDPYSSTLIEIWPYQLTGWNFTNRATKGRLKEFFTTVFLSLGPS